LKKSIVVIISFLVLLLVYANWPTASLPESTLADKVIVTKSKRQLAIYSGQYLLKVYSISLGKNPIDHKE
jgi:hypothetical protein